MYQFSYADIMDDAAIDARGREARALDRSVELLLLAEEAGPGTRAAIDALFYTARLWTALIEDLGGADNDLPKELRASLISVGIWVLKESERIRLGQSRDFKGMVEINTIVRGGLA